MLTLNRGYLFIIIYYYSNNHSFLFGFHPDSYWRIDTVVFGISDGLVDVDAHDHIHVEHGGSHHHCYLHEFAKFGMVLDVAVGGSYEDDWHYDDEEAGEEEVGEDLAGCEGEVEST